MTSLMLPDEDRTLSPHTGFTREHWAAVADHLLLSLRPYFSPGRARVLPPGRTSAYGVDSDGLEGFARSFLLFGFRLKGEDGRDPHGFLDWYRQGLITGTDPRSPEAWPRPDQLGQAKVEAASIALILQLTRPWLWQTLDEEQQRNVIAWLGTVVGEQYPPNNWAWFRILVETFLASVGGPYSSDDICADLALHESFAREHGWYSDGAERSYDYYSGWALHFYPLVWAGEPDWSETVSRHGADRLAPLWRERLADYLDDYVHLIGGDGMPVLEGRSLIYRFAAAAPLWVGAATGASRISPGLLRRSASGILRAFVSRGVPDERGLLTLGITREWPNMAQSYSGSGSPYWAAKGMYGLALPASHPVWSAVEEPLPVERGDTRRLIVAPGWLVSGTRDDGIVRVINHGTDHASAGDAVSDSPLYARLGYSSATIPPLTGETIESPVDSTVGVLDSAGRVSSRTGFVRLDAGADDVSAFAVSAVAPHWVDVADDAGPDHGSGRRGRASWGPALTVGSVVRGAWEVRVARVDRGEGTVPLRVSGWPLDAAQASQARVETSAGAAAVSVGPLHSQVRLLGGRTSATDVTTAVTALENVSPLADHTFVPTLTVRQLEPGVPLAVAVQLGAGAAAAPTARWEHGDDGLDALVVSWADGAESHLALPALAR